MHNGKILIYFYGNMYICLLVILIFQKCLYVTSHYVSASLHCNEKDHKQSAHQLTDVNEFCLKKILCILHHADTFETFYRKQNKYCSLGPDREFETIAETFFDAEYKVDTNVLVF